MLRERVNRARECIGEICWRLAGKRLGAKARSDPEGCRKEKFALAHVFNISL